MRRKMKRIVSLLMALTLVLCVSTTAFAAGKTDKDSSVIGFYEKDGKIYDCAITVDDISYGFMSPDEEQVELIVEWTAADGYLYLGYFYGDITKEEVDFYFCPLYDNMKAESKTVLHYTELIDALDGEQIADLTFTKTSDPDVVKMKWGERAEEWYYLDDEDSLNVMAALEEYMTALSK